MSAKQSIAIGALSGALVIALGAAGFLYWQSHGQPAAAPSPSMPNTPVAGAPVTVPEAAAIPAVPDAARALQDIFGSAGQGGTVKTPEGPAQVWYAQSFSDGNERLHVVFTMTAPVADSSQASHADAPAVSAVVYHLASGKWELVKASKNFTQYGSWGVAQKPERPFEVLRFPSGVLAFLVDGSGSGQGYTTVGKAVWSYSNQDWHDLGFVATGLDNEGAAMNDAEKFQYTGTISVQPGSQTFPDLLVHRTGTTRDESSSKVVAVKDTVFRFDDKESQYKEVESKR